MNRRVKIILVFLLLFIVMPMSDSVSAKENSNTPREIELLFSGLDDNESDRKSTRLNSSHVKRSRMPSSA